MRLVCIAGFFLNCIFKRVDVNTKQYRCKRRNCGIYCYITFAYVVMAVRWVEVEVFIYNKRVAEIDFPDGVTFAVQTSSHLGMSTTYCFLCVLFIRCSLTDGINCAVMCNNNNSLSDDWSPSSPAKRWGCASSVLQD